MRVKNEANVKIKLGNKGSPFVHIFVFLKDFLMIYFENCTFHFAYNSFWKNTTFLAHFWAHFWVKIGPFFVYLRNSYVFYGVSVAALRRIYVFYVGFLTLFSLKKRSHCTKNTVFYGSVFFQSGFVTVLHGNIRKTIEFYRLFINESVKNTHG